MRGKGLVLLSLLLIAIQGVRGKDAVDYIDPFIGTGHAGKDFPGASTPFGMTKVSPDTATAGVVSYSYTDKTVSGFSFTHIGGADGGELANLLTMATTGPLHTYWGQRGKPGTGYQSAFSKNSETASAGYYAVTLDDSQIRAEATAAPHSGILRFTFPENQQSRIQIDLSHRHDGTSLHQTVKVTDDHTIEGSIDCPAAGRRLALRPDLLHALLSPGVQQAPDESRRLERHAAAGLDRRRPSRSLRQRARTSAIPRLSKPARKPRSSRTAATRKGSTWVSTVSFRRRRMKW